MGILPSCSHADTTIWLHSNKMLEEKAKDETYTKMLCAIFLNPGSNTPQNSSCTITYFPSHKPFS